MKGLARQNLWWPSMNDDIKQITKHCTSYQEISRTRPSPPVAQWNRPPGPWNRLRSISTRYILTSLWVKCFWLSTTSAAIIDKLLRKVFANFGLPEHIVSENSPQFVGEEFENFLRKLTSDTAALYPKDIHRQYRIKKLVNSCVIKFFRILNLINVCFKYIHSLLDKFYDDERWKTRFSIVLIDDFL